MKTKLSLFFFIFFWISSAQAYPWMFFRESPSSLIQLDSHVSYFFNGKATIFSGAELAYHNPTIDINLGYNYSFLEKNHYFQISELSVVFPLFSKDWTMSLGVRDFLWSEADRYWNYGLWQARYLLDPLRPKQMGMPGLYFDYKTDKTSFLLSLSYFYIPDVIILPKLKNKALVSKNPFFINNLDSQFRWEVKELAPFELNRFFKPSLALNFKHFIEKSSISFSYAYKPVNQFQKAISLKSNNLSEKSINLSKSGGKPLQVISDFKYFIVSHHLMNLESETALTENVSLFASVFWEKPEQADQEEKWLTDNFDSHLTYSVIAYFQEKWDEDQKTLFTLGWTKTVDSSPEPQSNPILSEYKELFNRSFDWKSAISASIEHESKTPQNFLFRFRTLYALDNQFYQLILEHYFYFTPQIRLYLSGDMFYRPSNRAVSGDSSAVKQYKGLSRLLLGGQYVF